ncbi:3-hydroxyacyl-CoA dehydrogenase family protein [Bacillus sp. 1P10SD]|uniref:3-hydroxyacyl-CoA dehydrogenase family protein n=1 Tax=Bacillus sp. 1P10SD TaxID=3132265 RepID=UPI0039A46BFB
MIKTVTVIGANGTMGCNVSGIFASFGDAKVYLVSRTLEKAQKAVAKAAMSVKADAIMGNLIPADYSMLESCIKDSDLVFESVAENLNTKLEVNREISKYAGSDTIICTGSSGLSIKQLAEVFPESIRKNYMGVHFFNPPYNLTLCELIPSSYTDRKLFENVRDYVTKKLYRTAVEVNDSPAFLGNRIGFQFINEVLQYAEKYKDNGGIDYIDTILGQFTGRSMAPLVTSDFVGLDVHKAIVDNIYQNTSDYARGTFVMPQFAVDLVNSGKMGRKTKGGLYKLDVSNSGVKRKFVYDIATNSYREMIKYSFPYAENMVNSFKVGDYHSAFKTLINNQSKEAALCLEFLLKYVVYSLNATNLVGDGIQSADDVMATGFNWCPPLAVIQALFGVESFKSLAKERLSKEILDQIDLDLLLRKVEVSKYDFRRYFKAKH